MIMQCYGDYKFIGNICVPCKKELILDKRNIRIIHFKGNSRGNGIESYRYADLYYCPQCGKQVALNLDKHVIPSYLSDGELKKILDEPFVEVRREDNYEN